MQAQVTFAGDIVGGQVLVDLSPLEAGWKWLQSRAAKHRAADEGGARPGVARARCGCPCGAGAESILTDGVHRFCTRCGETH